MLSRGARGWFPPVAAPSSLPPRVASDWCVLWALALLLWRKPWKSMGLPSSKWVCIDSWGPPNPWLKPHDPHSMAVNGGKPMFRIVQTDSLFYSSNACIEWSCPLLMANLGHQAPPKKKLDKSAKSVDSRLFQLKSQSQAGWAMFNSKLLKCQGVNMH